MTYANAGIGAASHLCGMLFMSQIDTKLTTVPYKGTGPALTDLIGGQVDFMCDQTTNTTNQIKAGEIKAYASTTKERLKNLPDIPTAAEAGLTGIEVGVWHGLYAPKGTPPEVIDRSTRVAQKALADETVDDAFRRPRHRARRPPTRRRRMPSRPSSKARSSAGSRSSTAAGEYAD